LTIRGSLSAIEIAYRVVEESAVPLSLPKQIALGPLRSNLSISRNTKVRSFWRSRFEDGSGVASALARQLPGTFPPS